MGENSSISARNLILKYIALIVITGAGIWFATMIILNGAGSGLSIFLGAIIIISVLGVDLVFLRNDLYPLRWFAPGLVLMSIMVVYPVAYTSYIAFTNFGTGNLLDKAQTIEQFENRTFLPEEGQSFTWTAFRSSGGEFLLWLQSEGGGGELVAEGRDVTLEEVNAGPLDEDGVPTEIPGYERLARAQTLRFLSDLEGISFGGEGNETFVRSLNAAAQVQQKFTYNEAGDVLIDRETGKEFRPVDGRFTADDGEQLTPGYFVPIGLRNFERFFDPNNPSFRGPFIRIFLWTFVFAVLVVVTTFALGLFLALIFNDTTMPGRKIIQSLLLIPYALPAFISVQIWRGLLNPQFGVVSQFLADIFGSAPPWFSSPWWSKAGVLLVTLWLGFPYMFLICSGALQALPTSIYEAADIDGAGVWQKFKTITFPLLLVAVGPLLIASFAFNFNNFTVIDVFNEGGPPIPNSATPAGHTDILITYIFRLAFAGGRGVDYGYASAITIVIFVILAFLVGVQFRYTRVWEEVSENV